MKAVIGIVTAALVFSCVLIPFTLAQSPVEAAALEDIRVAWSLLEWQGNASHACEAVVWSGLACSEGHVTELVISQSLVASPPIPASMGNLTYLNVLNLGDCNLSGTIPSSIGQLVLLQQLNLTGNGLGGEIPSSIGQLQQLIRIELGMNFLMGNIPDSIGQLEKLQILDLSDNELSGGLPIALGQLTQLKELYLTNNNLKGKLPSALGNLSLIICDLSENNWYCPVPKNLPPACNSGWKCDDIGLDVFLNIMVVAVPLTLVCILAVGAAFLFTILCRPRGNEEESQPLRRAAPLLEDA